MTLQELLEQYLDDCYLRGLSEKTLYGYRYNIGMFMEFVGDMELGLFSKKHIADYQRFLLRKDISRYTVCNYLRPVKAFFNYVDREYNTDYAMAVVYPKRPKLLKYIYSDAEIKMMLRYLSTREMSNRDIAIFLLFYDCGLRLSEVIGLRTENIDFDRQIVKVLGKGSKERIVPFGVTLKYFLEHCEYGEREFFMKRDGTPINESTVRNLFRKMRKKTNIDVSPHNLRHNFATNFLLHQIQCGSVDLFQLQSIMGHSDAETTKIYLHFAKEILSTANPYSKLDALREVV